MRKEGEERNVRAEGREEVEGARLSSSLGFWAGQPSLLRVYLELELSISPAGPKKRPINVGPNLAPGPLCPTRLAFIHLLPQIADR